jgi:hypothetical protein
MPYEVVGEPFVGREESKGGIGRQRLYVTVRHQDGRTERMLASEALPKEPKGAKGKQVEGEAVLQAVAKAESPEVTE